MNGQQGGDPAKLTEAIVTLADSIRTLLLEWRLRPMPVDECTSTKSQPVNGRPPYGVMGPSVRSAVDLAEHHSTYGCCTGPNLTDGARLSEWTSRRAGGCRIAPDAHASGADARLGRIGTAGLSVLQTRILRLRLFNGVASALLVVFNAVIAVWPMVALNVTLTAINVFYIVRLARVRHDPQTFEVVEISPSGTYLKHLLHEFEADIQHFNPGFSDDDAARAEFGFLILSGAETVGLVLARKRRRWINAGRA